jgi:hypothetical protein
MSDDTVVHAYGVVADGEAIPEIVGIAGAPIELVELPDLAIVAASLPFDRYGPASWVEHAEDLQWLASVGREHHGVLQQLIAVRDVVPFRLPSIYATLDGLRTLVSDERDRHLAALAAVAGRVEWVVKAYRGPRPTASRPEDAAASGAAYLQSQSRRLREEEEAGAHFQEVVRHAHDRLTAVVADAVRNPVQDKALSGRDLPMALNGAYLVERRRTQEFLDMLAAVEADGADDGLVLESSGPWPAYSFAGRARSAGAGAP